MTKDELSELAAVVNYRVETIGTVYRLFDEKGNLLIDTVDIAEVGVLIDDEIAANGVAAKGKGRARVVAEQPGVSAPGCSHHNQLSRRLENV